MREKFEQSWLAKLLPPGRNRSGLAYGLLQWGWIGQGEGGVGVVGLFPLPMALDFGEGQCRESWGRNPPFPA